MADWIARGVNPYPSDPNSTGESTGRLDPDAHADAVIRALESRCEALGVGPSLLPAAAFQVAGIVASRGHEQRQAGRLDDARQTAACLSAFAKTLVRRDPDEAAFHLVLSAAFVQESKNAWKVRITLRSKTGCERHWAKLVSRYVSIPETRTRASRSPFFRTSWSVSSPDEGSRRKETGTPLVFRPNSPPCLSNRTRRQ